MTQMTMNDNYTIYLPMIDHGICLHWLWLSPSHLKEYFPVPANDDRVIINGRVLFHNVVIAL